MAGATYVRPTSVRVSEHDIRHARLATQRAAAVAAAAEADRQSELVDLAIRCALVWVKAALERAESLTPVPQLTHRFPARHQRLADPMVGWGSGLLSVSLRAPDSVDLRAGLTHLTLPVQRQPIAALPERVERMIAAAVELIEWGERIEQGA